MGYKRTEIGVIPEEWEICKFGTKAKIFRGGSPRPIQNFLTQSVDGVNWIKIGDVREGDKYISSTQEKIIPQGVLKSREVHVGDLILSNSMSFGRPYILNIDGCIHDGWLAIQNYDAFYNKEFLFYLLSSDFVYQQYLNMAAGSSVHNLNKEIVANLVTLCPPKHEQLKIAEVLSSMDALIDSLERLIEKKRAIRLGAVQELLSGRRRLPSFCCKWIVTTFGRAIKENPKSSVPVNSVVPANKGLYPFFVSGEKTRRFNRYLVSGENVFLNTGGCAGVKYYNGYAHYSTDTYSITGETISTKFLYYLLLNNIQHINDMYFQGNALHHLQKPMLQKLIITVPSSIEEQTAIATVLSDMDEEIDVLVAKLNKLRLIKLGMARELLTGHIRVEGVPTERRSVSRVNLITNGSEMVNRKLKLLGAQKKSHNQQFDDAVVIAGIVNAFYDNRFPLGRKKVQKCLYFLRRHQGESTKEFKKKAAGPYADVIRYRGGEPIAIRKKYIEIEQSSKGARFSKGENCGEALEYIKKWNIDIDINWLKSHFLLMQVDLLELISTIDMAMCELHNGGIMPSVEAVKKLICSSKAWKAKLKKNYFSDSNLEWAIKKCQSLFKYTEG